MVQISDRLKNRKTYIFAQLGRKKSELVRQGIDVLDLGTGDCSLGAPPEVVEALRNAALDIDRHHYSFYNGLPQFRKEVALWLEKRFNIQCSPQEEITAVIGSKEAVFRLPQVILNPGDIALIPEPSYPPYTSGALHAGGEVYSMPLKKENGFLPDMDSIPEEIKRKTRLIYLNYPGNPTTAVMTPECALKVMEEAEKYDWAVFSDMAYCEIYDTEPPLSMLQFDRSKSRVIELFSFSKSYNMTGFRLGFAAGCRNLVKGLIDIKTAQGSAPFEVVQIAGIEALRLPEQRSRENRQFYSRNRKRMKEILTETGIRFFDSETTFYIWAEVPHGYTSMEWCDKLLIDAHTITVPGTALGPSGEGWFRISLTREPGEIEEFAKRLECLT